MTAGSTTRGVPPVITRQEIAHSAGAMAGDEDTMKADGDERAGHGVIGLRPGPGATPLATFSGVTASVVLT